MSPSKLRRIAALWALALALSALPVAAGLRWPQPLAVRHGAVAALVFLPPLLMVFWLLARWRLTSEPLPPQGTESLQSAKERH